MSLNVLVVDDSAVMRQIILRSLRQTGLTMGTVCEAGTAEEALEVLARTWFDVALVDLNMPGMGGEALIERLRSTPAMSDLPVIVVSSESSEVRINRLEESGIVFVHKPFEPTRLREAVSQATGGYDEPESPENTLPDQYRNV